MKEFYLKSQFDLPLSDLFQWHIRDGAFERLNPPWSPLYIVSKKGSIDNRGIVIVKKPIIKDIGIRWKIRHGDYIRNKTFKDAQIEGIFSFWEHQHNFSEDMTTSIIEDKIKYSLPLGPIGNIFSSLVDNNLENIFKYRHRITKIDTYTHLKVKDSNINKILISGSSGFIGSALIPFLTTGGYNVTRMLRNKPNFEYDIAKRIYMNRDRNIEHFSNNINSTDRSSNPDTNNHFDAVINLNGESIFGLWNKNKKQKIFDSRVKFTRFLCNNLVKMDKPPKVLISASAIGIYGNDHELIFDEFYESNRNENKDFLSNICSQWEEATDLAKSAGIRVVNLRTGIVLGASGGFVKLYTKMNRLKINMKITKSENWLSWIALDDLLRVILFCVCNNNIYGPLNAVSPNNTSLNDLLKTLGKIWNTKIDFKVSRKTVERILGEMSQYTIFADNKVIPQKLISNNFNFIFKDLEKAMRHTLGKLNTTELE
jgi:uncharacterized protein